MSNSNPAGFVGQVRFELLGLLRNRSRTFFTIALPLMFLVIFSTLQSGTKIDTRGNISFVTFFVPGIIAYAILLSAFNSLAMQISMVRHAGVLKRIRTTPIPWSRFIAGIVVATLTTVLISVVVMLAVGVMIFGAKVRLSTLPGLISFTILGAICFSLLGIAAARLIRDPNAGTPILMFLTLPMTFISNVFFPLDGAPDWLNNVAKLLPLRPLSDGLQHAFDPATKGSGFIAENFLVLGIWTAIGAVLAVKYLRSLANGE